MDKAEFGVSITINQEALDRILKHAKDSLSRAMKYAATDVWGNIRRLAPTDTGRLAGSFELEQVDELSWRIFTNVHYALYVHEGTGIHGPEGRPIEIRPVRKKALYWPGAAHPVTKVLHPGQKPNPYVTRAIETTSGRVSEFIQRAIRETGWGET